MYLFFSLQHAESWVKCDDVNAWLNPDKPVVAQGVLDYRYFQKFVRVKEYVKHGCILNKVTLLHQLKNNNKNKRLLDLVKWQLWWSKDTGRAIFVGRWVFILKMFLNPLIQQNWTNVPCKLFFVSCFVNVLKENPPCCSVLRQNGC